MQRDKTEILKLKTDLTTVQPVYHYAGRQYAAKRFRWIWPIGSSDSRRTTPR